MIVRQLVTLLGFQVNRTGMVQYNTMLRQATSSSQAASITLGTFLGNMVYQTVANLGHMVKAGAQAIIEAGDNTITAANQIKSSLDDLNDFDHVFETLYQSSRRTGTGLRQTATAFGRISPAARAAGLSLDESMELVSGLQAALRVTGATTSEANSVVMQFGQAMNSGILSGEEFRSLAENSGKTVRLLAEELGVTVGQLREMSREQKLTTAVVLPAMLKVVRRMRQEFEEMEVTADLAFARLKVTLSRFIGDIMRTFGVTQAIAEALKSVEDFIERMRRGIPAVRAFVDQLGGLNRIGQLFTNVVLAAMILKLGTTISLVAGLSRALAVLAIRFAAPLLAVVALGMAIDDFRVWMQGGDSLLGRRFGEFGPAMESLRLQIVATFEQIRDQIMEILSTAMTSAIESVRQFVTEWEAVLTVVAAIGAAVAGAVAGARILAAMNGRGAAGGAPAFIPPSAAAAGPGAGAAASGAAAGAGAAAAGGAARPGLVSRALGLVGRVGGPVAGVMAGLSPTRAADATLTGNPEILRQLQSATAPTGEIVAPGAVPSAPPQVIYNQEFQADFSVTFEGSRLTPDQLGATVTRLMEEQRGAWLERIGRDLQTSSPFAEAPTR